MKKILTITIMAISILTTGCMSERESNKFKARVANTAPSLFAVECNHNNSNYKERCTDYKDSLNSIIDGE